MKGFHLDVLFSLGKYFLYRQHKKLKPKLSLQQCMDVLLCLWDSCANAMQGVQLFILTVIREMSEIHWTSQIYLFTRVSIVITHSCYLVSYDHRSSQFLFSAPRWSRWRCPLAVGNLRLRELELLMTFLITWSIFCGGQWWRGRGQGTGKRHTGWRGGGGFLSSCFHPPHSFYSSPPAGAGSPWWLCPPHSSFLVTAPVPF